MHINDTCGQCSTPTNIRPPALAARLGTSVKTLANMRHRGEGPAYFKVNSSVLYAMRDVLAYEEANRVPAGAAA